jgi:hypothetical protein
MTTRIDAIHIAKLFQSLHNLTEKQSLNLKLPDDIDDILYDFEYSIEQFIRGIDAYMHKEERDVTEAFVVKSIIDNCPEFLSMKDEQGYIPIHKAALDHISSSTFVPMLAMEGLKQGVGGPNGRGGLLLNTSTDEKPLKSMARNGSLDTMKALKNSEPSLLKGTDVSDHVLLHIAAKNGQNLDMVKMFIKLNPLALYKKSSSGNLPLHSSCQSVDGSIEVAKLLIESALEYDPYNKLMGGLFTKNNCGEMGIDLMIKYYGQTKTWQCIEQAFSQCKDCPILHRAILQAPQYLNAIITSFPHASFLRDENNRLPIHVAIASGMKWSLPFVSIMNANCQHLLSHDPVTGLYPCALAAVQPSCDLRTINYLFRKFLQSNSFVEQHSQGHFSVNNDSSPLTSISISDNISFSDNDTTLSDDESYSVNDHFSDNENYTDRQFEIAQLNSDIIDEFNAGLDALMTSDEKDYFLNISLAELIQLTIEEKEDWLCNVQEARYDCIDRNDECMQQEKETILNWLQNGYTNHTDRQFEIAQLNSDITDEFNEGFDALMTLDEKDYFFNFSLAEIIESTIEEKEDWLYNVREARRACIGRNENFMQQEKETIFNWLQGGNDNQNDNEIAQPTWVFTL